MASPSIRSGFFRQLVKGEEYARMGVWLGVQSSDVSAFRYDLKNHTLWIMFQRGAVYFYPDIPIEVATSMYNAPYMGKFIHKLRRAGYKGYPLKGHLPRFRIF